MRVRGSVTVRRLPPSPAVVIQAGARTFRKSGEEYSPASITARAEVSNVKSPVYEWGRLVDGTFNLVASWTGASITVLPEQAGVVMVRVRGSNIADPVSDYVDISVVEDGENGESLSGRMLHTDPTFKRGTNGVSKYSNAAAEVKALLVVERVERPEDAPTTSTHCLRVTCKAEQSPGFGGVCQSIQSRANAVFVQKIIAKLPIGYKLNAASNSMGSGYTDVWLTSTEGTGKYETYLRKVTCGASGTFSTGGHLYVTGGPVPTEEAPLVWHIAYMTAFDQTDDGYEQIETASKDALAEKLGYGSWEEMVDKVSSAGSIIQGDYIRATLIDVETLATNQAFIDKLLGNELEFKRGKIGKFNIGENRIYTDGASESDAFSGPVPAGVKQVINANDTFIVSERGDLLLGDPFNLKGNGQYGLALINNEGNTVLNLYGNVYAEGGKIGGFTIENGGFRTSAFDTENETYYGFMLNNQLLHYTDINSNYIYLGAHPDQSVGGKIKLGTFVLDGGDYTSMSSGDSVALICAAPTTATIIGKSVALWVNGVSVLRGIDLINRLGTRSGTVTVTPNDSVMCISGDVTLSADSNLKYLCDDGFVHAVLIVNTSNSKRYIRGLRNGNSATILGYWSKLFCYTQGYWYGPSDEY